MAKRFWKYILTFCLLIGVSAGWAPSVRAEFVVDLYGGLAKTENGHVEGQLRSVPFSGSPVTTSKDLKQDAKFKNALTVGGRVTYWTQTIPWLGLALDGSYFKADAKTPILRVPFMGSPS